MYMYICIRDKGCGNQIRQKLIKTDEPFINFVVMFSDFIRHGLNANLPNAISIVIPMCIASVRMSQYCIWVIVLMNW